MVRSRLRNFFLGAFTGRYYEKAEKAYENLQTMMSDPKTRFRKDSLPFGKGIKKIPGVQIFNSAFAVAHDKLDIMVADLDEIQSREGMKGAMGFLVDYHSPVFWIIKSTRVYVLVIGLKVGGAPLTKELIQSQFKTSRVLKHLFIHEYVHYLQGNQFANVLLPLSNYHNSLKYIDKWQEVEAWNVESFSRYLSTLSKKAKAEAIQSEEHFRRSFVIFLLKKHRQGAVFFVQMTRQQQDQFLRESYAILRKKMNATEQGA